MVFGLEKFFDALLEKELRPSRDRLFRLLLNIEFYEDLRYVQRLSAVPHCERTQIQNLLEDYFKEKYPVSGKCCSVLYSKVSKPLRREYNIIHRRMMEILHPIL